MEVPETKSESGWLRWLPACVVLFTLIGQGTVLYSRLQTIESAVTRHDGSLARIEDGSANALRTIVERVQTDEKRADDALNAINSQLNAIQTRFVSDNSQISDLKAQMAVLATKSDLERESIRLLGDRVSSMIEIRSARR